MTGSLPFESGPIVAYIDGGARGNPGPAGYGVRIEEPGGTLIEEFGEASAVIELSCAALSPPAPLSC